MHLLTPCIAYYAFTSALIVLCSLHVRKVAEFYLRIAAKVYMPILHQAKATFLHAKKQHKFSMKAKENILN